MSLAGVGRLGKAHELHDRRLSRLELRSEIAHLPKWGYRKEGSRFPQHNVDVASALAFALWRACHSLAEISARAARSSFSICCDGEIRPSISRRNVTCRCKSKRRSSIRL